MVDIANCLKQIDVLMEDYQELPTCREIFEAGSGDVEEITTKNTEVEKKTKSLLQKICNAIKAIFHKIGEALKSVGAWFTAGKGEIAKYKNFVEMVKQDPSLAKTKITLKDYRKINEQREQLLAKEEEKYRRMKDDEVANRPSLGKDMQEGLNYLKEKALGIAKTAGSVYTLEVVLEFAKTGRKQAMIVQEMIRRDMFILNGLEKELGKKDIWMFKKKVKILQSRFDWIRKIAGGRQEQALSIKQSVEEALKAVDGEMNKVYVKTGLKNPGAAKYLLREGRGIKKLGRKMAKSEALNQRDEVVRMQTKAFLGPNSMTNLSDAERRKVAKEITKENRKKRRAIKREIREKY